MSPPQHQLEPKHELKFEPKPHFAHHLNLEQGVVDLERAFFFFFFFLGFGFSCISSADSAGFGFLF